LLQLLDPRTASYSHLAKVPCIGVAAEEHIANKGIVSISVWTDGLFDVTASGALTLGQPVVCSLQDNKVQGLVANDIASGSLQLLNTLGSILGVSYETGSDAEVLTVRLNL
jgi:hypothetical protein